MKVPDLKYSIEITSREYLHEGCKLDILKPSEVTVKELTDDYVVLASTEGIVEVNDGGISLSNSPKEIKIQKGECKTVTLPVTDYFHSVTIQY